MNERLQFDPAAAARAGRLDETDVHLLIQLITQLSDAAMATAEASRRIFSAQLSDEAHELAVETALCATRVQGANGRLATALAEILTRGIAANEADPELSTITETEGGEL